jgi:hypothetical protein
MPTKLPQAALPHLKHRPQRRVTSANLEDDLKSLIDFIHKFWELSFGVTLSQPDVMRILVMAALEHPQLLVPSEAHAHAAVAFAEEVGMAEA